MMLALLPNLVVECLSTEYKNARTPLMWRCSKNHTCPEHAIQIAVFKRDQCLSTEYVNSKVPMLWKCQQDHIWSTPFKNIKYLGTWCPHCAGMPF